MPKSKEKRKRQPNHIGIIAHYILPPLLILVFIATPAVGNYFVGYTMTSEYFIYPTAYILGNHSLRFIIGVILLVFWIIWQFKKSRQIVLELMLSGLVMFLCMGSLLFAHHDHFTVNVTDTIKIGSNTYYLRELKVHNIAKGLFGLDPYFSYQIVHKCDMFHVVCETEYSEYIRESDDRFTIGSFHLNIENETLSLVYQATNDNSELEMIAVIENDSGEN